MLTLRPSEVRKKLLDFQLGRVVPEDFAEWATLSGWDLPPGTDGEVVRLLSRVELYLAEYTSGHRSLDDLKKLVGDLVVRAEIDLAGDRKLRRYSTSSIAPVSTSTFNCAV
jgi:hypothetical protein